jgi:hypothetical protein
MNPASFGPFRGINNRRPDFAMKTDAGDWLRAAMNVDLDDAGRLRRRVGQTRIQALTDPHSLYQTADGRLFVVISAMLYLITLPTYSQTLIKALSSNSRVFYAEHNGSIYYSNAVDSGRISRSNAWYPWALPTPDLPAVSSIAGALPAGKYLVAVTYTNSDTGEEGGAKGSTQHTLAAPGAMRVTLPAATTGATHINVYVSDLNGSVPRLHGAVATGAATYDVAAASDGRPWATAGLEPMPAATGLFFHKGRLGAIT